MVNIRIGIQLDTGTAWSSPSSSAPQPHWKTAVTTPYAAPMLSRFMTAALSGTTTERNTIASSRIETPTTKPITSHSRSASRSAMSENIGVVPVTSTPSGTIARTSATRSGVRSSVGAYAGTALKTAISPSGDTTGGVTATMSLRASSSAARSAVPLVADLVAVDDDRQRTVVAGAELARRRGRTPCGW